MKTSLLVLFFSLVATIVTADDNIVMNCNITPEIYHANIPTHFNKSNNLRRLTGSPMVSEGKLIYISGIATDKHCVPIQNARISIWHVDAYGHDHKAYLSDEHFAGTGTAITDNVGNYNFITIVPGEYSNKEYAINITVHHSDFIPLDTRMFFSNKSQQLQKFDPNIAQRLVLNRHSDNQYKFDISLNGSSFYKKH